MPVCKNCGEKVIVGIDLKSNIAELTGFYCSGKCMEDFRAKQVRERIIERDRDILEGLGDE